MTRANLSMTAQLETAAAALAADPLATGVAAGEAGLLRYLDYNDGDAAQAPARVRMLRAAARLRRLFLLSAPDAPGLVFFGAEADPSVLDSALAEMPAGSMAGSGLTPRRAFEACVGEAIEYLSQFVRGGDRIDRATTADRLASHASLSKRFITELLDVCGVDPADSIDWIALRNIATGAEAWFPADLCLRRPDARRDIVPPLKLSTGCAAGITAEAATLRAMLELLERDAAALWWRGGRRGRFIPRESDAASAAIELLTQLRQGRNDRRTWLLDITTDLGIPVVAAVSSAADDLGFAFGLGARTNLADAAGAAIFEMCQVELGPRVVAAKREESGDSALQEGDLRHLRRTTLINTRNCALLHPTNEPGRSLTGIPSDPAAALHVISERLARHGIDTFALDLTRPDFDVPVVRVVAPGLQLDPCQIVGQRLARAIHETGGGAMHTGGLSLL